MPPLKTLLRPINIAFYPNIRCYYDIIITLLEVIFPAAIISDQLAKEVDFFSVGTNDLTQYTFAMDRQNSKLEALYDKHHPAVLTLIKMAADNAHANGKWIGICGELGADLELTGQFIDMGINELSVSPGMLLKLREKIRSL